MLPTREVTLCFRATRRKSATKEVSGAAGVSSIALHPVSDEIDALATPYAQFFQLSTQAAQMASSGVRYSDQKPWVQIPAFLLGLVASFWSNLPYVLFLEWYFNQPECNNRSSRSGDWPATEELLRTRFLAGGWSEWLPSQVPTLWSESHPCCLRACTQSSTLCKFISSRLFKWGGNYTLLFPTPALGKQLGTNVGLNSLSATAFFTPSSAFVSSIPSRA